MNEYTPTTEEFLEALAFSYGYGLGGLKPCPDERIPNEVVSEWLQEERARVWDEGLKAGETNSGNGFAALLSGVEGVELETNPYRKP